MFKFFSGTIDEFLAQAEINSKHAAEIFNPNREMSYDEAVACLMDEQKISKTRARKIVDNVLLNGNF